MQSEPSTQLPEAFEEEGLLFEGAGTTLVGVLARPPRARPVSGIGVVIVVGGPQTRVGSHRQFVALARTLAAAGHVVLRFDYRGMGDSGGAARDFLSVEPDIEAAVTALQAAAASVRSVALWGLCDGASAALLYCHRRRDPRVDRLVLLNPWVRSPEGLARMQVKHYYRQRLLERAFWLKLLSGRVAWRALSDLARTVRTLAAGRAATTDEAVSGTPFPARMAAACNAFDGSILLLLSENDYTAKEFIELADSDAAWRQALARPALARRDITGADHTFSDADHARTMEQTVADWLTGDGARVRMSVRQAGKPAPVG